MKRQIVENAQCQWKVKKPGSSGKSKRWTPLFQRCLTSSSCRVAMSGMMVREQSLKIMSREVWPIRSLKETKFTLKMEPWLSNLLAWRQFWNKTKLSMPLSTIVRKSSKSSWLPRQQSKTLQCNTDSTFPVLRISYRCHGLPCWTYRSKRSNISRPGLNWVS